MVDDTDTDSAEKHEALVEFLAAAADVLTSAIGRESCKLSLDAIARHG